MKKFNILSITVLLCFAFSFVGCEGTCVDCTGCLLDVQNTTYCEGEFDSKEAYNQGIADLESGGCTCL